MKIIVKVPKCVVTACTGLGQHDNMTSQQDKPTRQNNKTRQNDKPTKQDNKTRQQA